MKFMKLYPLIDRGLAAIVKGFETFQRRHKDRIDIPDRFGYGPTVFLFSEHRSIFNIDAFGISKYRN